ncbi:hypothetical protein I6H88_04330 [Elizabethkingia bruuniana]|uniref:Uncharacterized protein n=1 Tax=Elizabethkingia bruuniana TaxID=1756149 RepID=A0A7T7V161_9FLAO|nr:hypothetical protein [Elizabethkingia bruuniana]KGO09293.1 hypothetical protein KS04_15540 [Elizabethkingia miricola]MDV3604834.1 hypothetical protein [Elizabethkingia anophelis]AQX86533.1 hypothetical protein AYC65_16655 [Elizabethkingia bruuniana]KUY26133.1 hypothetical protein ATB97_19500 [Elizabethkingia bruuniana]OPB67905.1 hypothetical protein BAY12_14890 [Elizabethkingia bruuniana]
MIKLTQVNDVIRMEIKMHIPQSDIISFLQIEGYEIKAFIQKLPATEEMLVNEPKTEVYTFTATKQDEKQSENTLYLKVFETEVKKLLKTLNK